MRLQDRDASLEGSNLCEKIRIRLRRLDRRGGLRKAALVRESEQPVGRYAKSVRDLYECLGERILDSALPRTIRGLFYPYFCGEITLGH